MPLSLFRLFAAVVASVMSVHASSNCRYAGHVMASTDRALTGLRQAVSLGAASSLGREAQGASGGRVSLASDPADRQGHSNAYVVGVVTRGRFILQEDGKPPRVIGIGGAFFESADAPGLRLDSATPNASARMVGVALPRTLSYRAHHGQG
jgi:hypothetical protein